MKNLELIKQKIRTVPNFPKPGIMFRDITTLLNDPQGLRLTIKELVERYKNKRIDAIAGIEARGFILGGAMAYEMGIGFIALRKKGKLPYKTESVSYDLEYGKDTIECHIDSIKKGQNILIIDDLIATGGTALAGCQLVEKLGGIVVECAFIVDLPELKGKEKLLKNNYPVFALVEFEGE